MLSEACLYTAGIAVISHYFVLKPFEPNVLVFIGSVPAAYTLLFAIFLPNNRPLAVSSVLEAGWSAFVLEAVYLAALGLSVAIYRISPWHPLAAYPGPWLAKISKWWLAYYIAKGNRHKILQGLHKKHGPWLRIGPNEISVSSPSSIRPIYASMYRAPFYRGAPGDADALITTKERKDYSLRLVAWTEAFNSDSLKRYRPFVQARTTQLVDIIAEKSGTVLDLTKWISLWAMDNMGDMSFSGGFETMAAGKDSEGWLNILMTGSLAVGVLGQVPWFRDIIALLPQPGPIVTFQQFLRRKIRDIRKDTDGVPRDILGTLQDNSSGKYQLTEAEAAADATFMVVAGEDTVKNALVSFFRYVLADKGILNRLGEEMREALDDGSLEPAILARLPYLDACVQETLRMMPPVPAGPPRYSGTSGTIVENRYIPAYTTVSCPIYVLHHDVKNFNNPDTFDPQRWLDPSIKPHNTDAFMPFSAGIGICLGKQMALYNMKLLVTSLLRRFEFCIPADFSLDSFDDSYKEHNLWFHSPLLVTVGPLQSEGQ